MPVMHHEPHVRPALLPQSMASSFPGAATVHSTAASRAARWHPRYCQSHSHTPCVCVVEECVCARREPHGARLPGITPSGMNDRLELRPVGGIQVLGTPLLQQLRRGRLRARELLPGGAGGLVLWPGDITQLRMHPAVDDRHVLLSALVPRSWHLSLPPMRHAVSISRIGGPGQGCAVWPA